MWIARLVRVVLAAAIALLPTAARTMQPAHEPLVPRAAPATTPVRAVVSIPPLRGLVEPLLPKGSTLDVLIPPGVSEHGYEIPPSKMAALARADLVVYVGLGLEPQVEKFVKENPSEVRQVVGFAEIAGVETGEHAGHDHEGHDHHHAVDPHLWLDPVMAKALVKQVALAAVTLAGPHRKSPDDMFPDATASAYEALKTRVDRIDIAYREELGRAPRRTILVGHDAYGWLAKRYNLEVIAISGLTAAEPTPSALAAAMKAAKEKSVKVIFVEPQLSPAAARRIADATGLKVLTLDPLGDGDWFKMMQKNLEALKAALCDEPAKPASATPAEPPKAAAPALQPASPPNPK